jgi:hypothetical protein
MYCHTNYKPGNGPQYPLAVSILTAGCCRKTFLVTYRTKYIYRQIQKEALYLPGSLGREPPVLW